MHRHPSRDWQRCAANAQKDLPPLQTRTRGLKIPDLLQACGAKDTTCRRPARLALVEVKTLKLRS